MAFPPCNNLHMSQRKLLLELIRHPEVMDITAMAQEIQVTKIYYLGC